MSNSTAPAKKANATTEVVLGAAAAKFTGALSSLKTGLQAGLDQIEGLESKVSELTVAVVAKQDELSNLDVQFQEKRRSQKVELELAEKADIAQVAEKYATANNKLIVDKAVQERNEKELFELNQDFASKVQQGVGAATSAMRTQHQSDLSLKDAEFRAKEAQNTADLKAQQQVISNLELQVESLNEQIREERAASVERAKAQGSSTVNVSGQGR